MKRVALITGTSGFIGSHLARALESEYEVIGINRRPISAGHANVVWKFGESLPAELPDTVDLVVHSAAATGGPDRPGNECFEVNTQATAQLLRFALRASARHFIHLSTGSVYAFGDDACRETDTIDPQDQYACTKAAAEFLVKGYAPQLNTLSLRMFFPYGPGQRLPRLIPRLIDAIRRGATIPINGPQGRPAINPVFIDDVVTWICRMIDAEVVGTFNVAGQEIVTIRELAEQIAMQMKLAPQFDVKSQYHGDLIADISRVCGTTGYEPQVKLERGLARLLSDVGCQPASSSASL